MKDVYFGGAAILLLMGCCSLNVAGVCMGTMQRVSFDDALAISVLQTVQEKSTSNGNKLNASLQIRTLDDARAYVRNNKDCCGSSSGVAFFRRMFGQYHGAYWVTLPLENENAVYARGATLTNCMKPYDLQTSHDIMR